MIKSLLGALKAVWTFILDTVRDFFNWLKKPGNKLKLVCAVLAFGTAIAAMQAYKAEQAIVVFQLQCEADKTGLQSTIAARDLTITEKNQALSKIEANLKAEAAKLLELQSQNAALEAENKRKAAAAEKSAAAFQREYANKPPTCTAALEMMEAACPTLRDY